MNNITLSISDDLLARSRRYAAKHNTSFNKLILDLLERQLGEDSHHPADALIKHSEAINVKENWDWNRDKIYER